MARIIAVIPCSLAARCRRPAAPRTSHEDEPTALRRPLPPVHRRGRAGSADRADPSHTAGQPPARYWSRAIRCGASPPAFLKNPWKWPDLWGINKDVVRNPHWIYPGDVLILDLTGATPRLRLEGAPDGGLSRWYGYELQVSKLKPQMRSKALAPRSPPSRPRIIDPFLVRPLIVMTRMPALAPDRCQRDDNGWSSAATIRL